MDANHLKDTGDIVCEKSKFERSWVLHTGDDAVVVVASIVVQTTCAPWFGIRLISYRATVLASELVNNPRAEAPIKC